MDSIYLLDQRTSRGIGVNDNFVCYGPSGILGSNGKQNAAKAGARGLENFCTFH